MLDNPSGLYDDMIDLPRPELTEKRRISMLERTAQFASFEALTGLDDQLTESARLTSERLVPDEKQRALIAASLRLLKELETLFPIVDVTYFVPDKEKSGGAYVRYSGLLRWLDEDGRMLHFIDDTAIFIDDIYEIRMDVDEIE